jgi:hypothetical protein
MSDEMKEYIEYLEYRYRNHEELAEVHTSNLFLNFLQNQDSMLDEDLKKLEEELKEIDDDTELQSQFDDKFSQLPEVYKK